MKKTQRKRRKKIELKKRLGAEKGRVVVHSWRGGGRSQIRKSGKGDVFENLSDLLLGENYVL